MSGRVPSTWVDRIRLEELHTALREVRELPERLAPAALENELRFRREWEHAINTIFDELTLRYRRRVSALGVVEVNAPSGALEET